VHQREANAINERYWSPLGSIPKARLTRGMLEHRNVADRANVYVRILTKGVELDESRVRGAAGRTRRHSQAGYVRLSDRHRCAERIPPTG
jgi:hypothetical protein